MDHPFHELANEYPLMPDAELLRLAESIRANGQREPVTWHEGLILDGRNRWLACKLIDPTAEPEGVEYDGETDEDSLRAFVEDRNEHRRHLEHKWLARRREERVARVAEKRRAGKSLRSIAEEEGVSPEQVRQDVVASRVKGLTPEPESGKVVGRDGKEYVAPEPKRQPQPVEDDAEGNAEKCEQAPVMRDGVGLPVPEKLAETFGALGAFRDLRVALTQAQQHAGRIAQLKGGEAYRRELGHKKSGDKLTHYCEHVANAISRVKFYQPHAAACPYCHDKHPGKTAKDCKACGGLGWVTKFFWDNAPQEYRDAVLADLGDAGGAR